jgi:ketosteroid isomerase-like protein
MLRSAFVNVMCAGVAAVTILVGPAATASAQDRSSSGRSAATAGSDEQSVRQAERDRFAAMVKADVAALDKMLGADLTYTHGDGRVIDKAAFLSDFKTGAFKYVSIDPGDMKVRIYGETAVVTGGAGMSVVNNGAPAQIKIRYTVVHVKRNGAWQMVAWEATRLPQ